MTIYCMRECANGPCEAEIEVSFVIDPYYAATRESPAEGGDRYLTSDLPAFCSRLHLFTGDEHVTLEVAAERAVEGYDEGSDDY